MIITCQSCKAPLLIVGKAPKHLTCPECHHTLQDAPGPTRRWTPDDGSLRDIEAEVEEDRPYNFGNDGTVAGERIDPWLPDIHYHNRLHVDWSSWNYPRRTNQGGAWREMGDVKILNILDF